MTASDRPLIGITPDLAGGRCVVRPDYADRVAAAGGLPVILSPDPGLVGDYLRRCRGFVFTGGDDPVMEPFGERTHPEAKPIDPRRQAFEVALLEALRDAPGRPVLGVCLGMQLMALVAGGRLDQHLPDTLPTAGRHWGRVPHPVAGVLGAGTVHSHHRQAITDPGALRVVATADDGVIEAVRDPDRPFYLGVQWHCERTEDPALGAGLLRGLVEACREGSMMAP